MTQRNNVLNLSDRALSEDEISILSKGLKFVTTPTGVNRTDLTTDLKNWGRRVRLKEYFGDGNSSGSEKDKFRKPSNWTPPLDRNITLDCYITAVKNAVLEGAPSGKKLRLNITRKQREVLTTLKQGPNIVIFQADKGSAVVVQNRRDYLAEANKQLNGKDENGADVYQNVPFDPTTKFTDRVREAVNKALHSGVTDEETACYFNRKTCKTW